MTGSYPNTWKGVEKAAKKAGARYPELVAAQWALESGWGKHTSGKHNYFGLKGQGSECETNEVIDGETITIRDNFLNFDNLGQCVYYLVERWYKDFESWKGVNNAVSRDAAAYELKAQGYATDPNYVTKLIELMDNHATNGVEKVAQDSCARIQAVQDTWLKKETVQSSELGEDERVAVPVGKSYSVLKWNELPTQAHAEVSLDHGAGTWYIYEPHWKHEGPHRDKPDVDWEDFDCLLTPNITVGEVLQYDKRRIPAKGASVRARLLRTAAEFQKVRDAWGGPLGVTSFYRPEPINQQVGGVPGSRHVVGEAFDVYPVDRSLESFYQWIRVRWTGGLGDGRHRGFVHMDTRVGGGFVPGAGARPAAEWTY